MSHRSASNRPVRAAVVLWATRLGEVDPMALAGERHHGSRLTGDDVPARRLV